MSFTCPYLPISGRKVSADPDPPLSSLPEKLSEEEDPQHRADRDEEPVTAFEDVYRNRPARRSALADQLQAAEAHAFDVALIGGMHLGARRGEPPFSLKRGTGPVRKIMDRFRQADESGQMTWCRHLKPDSPRPAVWQAWRPSRLYCMPCAAHGRPISEAHDLPAASHRLRGQRVMSINCPEKNSLSSGICVAPLKPGSDLGKRRYAGLRSRRPAATHCVALRSGLRSSRKHKLTCINIDHLEGCYAATQI